MSLICRACRTSTATTSACSFQIHFPAVLHEYQKRAPSAIAPCKNFSNVLHTKMFSPCFLLRTISLTTTITIARRVANCSHIKQRTMTIETGNDSEDENEPAAPPKVTFTCLVLLLWLSLVCHTQQETTKTRVSGRGKRVKGWRI